MLNTVYNPKYNAIDEPLTWYDLYFLCKQNTGFDL